MSSYLTFLHINLRVVVLGIIMRPYARTVRTPDGLAGYSL